MLNIRCNRIQWTALALSLGVAGITLTANTLAASPADKAAPPTAGDAIKRSPAAHPLTEDEKIVHVLNRLGFGPRPGDVAKVKAMGLSRYIDMQLRPESIDDSAVDRQLAGYAQLQLSGEQLDEEYNTFLSTARTAQTAGKAIKKQAARDNAAAGASEATPGVTNAAPGSQNNASGAGNAGQAG